MKIRYRHKLQNSIFAQSIRNGLTLAIPFLIMGSFALLFKNFPIPSYQAFLESFLGGALYTILGTLYDISLGSLALVLCLAISLSYGRLVETDYFLLYPVVSVTSYLAFCGGIESNQEYIFKAEWVFTAMCITLLSCFLFQKGWALSRKFERLHTMGAEFLFNISIQSLGPALVIAVLFAVCGYLLRLSFGDSNITNFGAFLFLKLFRGISGDLSGILLYVLITHLLWFLGIHGTNTLESVSQKLFEQGIDINQSLIRLGKAPTEIFSKTFLDTFVFLGGCGCALSLVIALCISARKSHNRKLASVALPSALFNISEIVVFGFPVIFNVTMFIPFVLSPLVLTLISTLAMKTGLVPLVTQSVGWTVPILLSGYQATGSVAGSILQLVNLAVGVLIYIPFIKRSEEIQTQAFQKAVRQMERDMAAGEKSGILPRYLHFSYPHNYYAKTLSMDLKNALHRNQIQLFYQPQVSDNGTLHGAEALLRWRHPIAGYIAPPVIIGLAYDSGLLDELGYYLLDSACRDAERMTAARREKFHLSVNISPRQLEDPDFPETALGIIQRYRLEQVCLVLEITEQNAMQITEEMSAKLAAMHRQGISFSMDDFGMGHSSMIKMQGDLFDEVKLDGNLVTQLLTNERSGDIISGIVHMSSDLHFRIIAEYVETEELRQRLQELGCTIYQGYYFSRPLPLEEFISYIKKLPQGRT